MSHLVRARCALAWRRWRGVDLDADGTAVEVLAGAILDAEASWDVHRLREAFEQVNAKQ